MNKFQRLFLLLTFTAMASVYAQQSFSMNLGKKQEIVRLFMLTKWKLGILPNSM